MSKNKSISKDGQIARIGHDDLKEGTYEKIIALLRIEIEAGVNSRIADNFDPKEHLKMFKANRN